MKLCQGKGEIVSTTFAMADTSTIELGNIETQPIISGQYPVLSTKPTTSVLGAGAKAQQVYHGHDRSQPAPVEAVTQQRTTRLHILRL
jgi:hypothetical protein